MHHHNLRDLMADAKFYESYSRFIKEEGRYETWAESVERVMNTHRQKYKGVLANNEELRGLFDEVQDAYTKKIMLGSQRALQFGGEQLLKHEFRLFNCVKKTTRFVTSTGVKSFEDFRDGDVIEVLTHTGKWKSATVKSHGVQSLNKIVLERNHVQKIVEATSNHRWLLADGSIVDDLKVGDRLLKEPNIFGDFEWKVISITSSTTEEVWCLDVEDDHSFVIEGGIVTGNCLGGHANTVNYFGEYFYLLLCGCGVGVSVQKHHVGQLPMIRPRTKQPKTHVCEDSIEGWATAVDVLLSSYFIGGGKHPEYEGRRVFFDTSPIRDKGAPISGGFKAPGPEPLQRCLAKIERLLNSIAEDGILRPIHVYDISMFIADAVLSGGVRRAATIFIFSVDDEEMMNAKTGDWFNVNPQRRRSNNSAVCIRDQFTKEEFVSLVSRTKEFGEPGFVFVDDVEMCFNPCVTADTWIETTTGLKQVKDLINTPFNAVVDGKSYPSLKGFWKTGTKDVFEVKTKRGYKVKVTDNHKILVQRGKERLWVEVKDAKIGDQFVLNKNHDLNFDIDAKEFDSGWLLGEIIGDGCYNPEKYPPNICFWGGDAERMANLTLEKIDETMPSTYNVKLKSRNYKGKYTIETKRLSALCDIYISPKTKNILIDAIPTMSKSFICGLMRGWFDADGTVLDGGIKNSRSIRLCSSNLERLNNAQMLLSVIGIASTIYENRRSEHMCMGYVANPVHELHISKDNIDRFADYVGFYEPTKQQKLNNIIMSRKRSNSIDKFLSEIVSIEPCGSEDVYDCTIEDIHCFSANGLIVHNCVEIGFHPILNGKHGWSACNLTEINGDKCETEEAFYYACRMASIMGTIQAGYTQFKFVSETTKQIIEKEALLGVSLTGWLDHPDVLLNPEVMKKGAAIVKETNKKVAKMLGINQAARTTCVKPAGNASVLLGTVSGVHPEHSKRYLRSVQMNKIQEVASIIKDTNPYMVEDSVWSEGDDDYVIAFPVIAPKASIVKKDLNAIKFLDIIKLIQVNWVWEGTNENLCIHPKTRNNVSNTVHVEDNEWDAVIDYLFENRNYFTAVSLLSATGSKDYHQAPYNEVYTEVEIARMYGPASMFASGLIVDSVNGFANLWDACKIAMNPETDTSSQETKDARSDWIRRFHKFAENHFGGDLKKTSYCLKDVSLLHKWTKIQNNYVNPKLEETLKIAKATDIDTMGAVACSAGGCEF